MGMKQRWHTISYTGLRAALFTAALALVACASDPAPVEDRSLGARDAENAQTARAPRREASAIGTYRVVKGDTLYAIAFKHGLDYRDLATWNGIGSPYRIYAGQELRLNAPAQASAIVATSAVPDRTGAANVSPMPATQQNPHVENAPPPRPAAPATVAKPPPVSQLVVEDDPAPAPEEAPVKTTPAPQVAVTEERQPQAQVQAPKPVDATAQLNAGGVTWRWPSSGKVVGVYVSGDQIRQGIDIVGKSGDPVLAAADGEIVYSGNGLLGYGELVIIKHNANFLSAYGHNRKRLVQEGDKVKAGQQIAEMGSSASAREELHFEIRKNGKPVNPLDYLPVR